MQDFDQDTDSDIQVVTTGWICVLLVVTAQPLLIHSTVLCIGIFLLACMNWSKNQGEHNTLQVASLASATPSVTYARFARSLTWAWWGREVVRDD